MYRLRLISRDFGVDDSGPWHSTHEQARKAAKLMYLLYKGEVRVEIHRVVDLRSRKMEKVEELQ
ncbi:hypothetical protein EAY64_15540 [Aquitalea palustris]|uniref:Uncharacterized protein n=1 Tax=Aquitalea palustris TaxID=2480983 RepID=A0A454JFE6_9NEIS|nr:hypothetical protein [Aquitalea palustris]RMC94368.1 hypothetical protein EAY64_15540 [Aquitalea palustris]